MFDNLNVWKHNYFYILFDLKTNKNIFVFGLF